MVPEPVDDEKFITREVLGHALALAGEGMQKSIHLFNRGEPLLHPEIGMIVSRVREAGFGASIATNMIAATEAKCREILRAGIDQIQIHYSAGILSLDHREMLERILMLRKLNMLERDGKCDISINYILGDGDSRDSVVSQITSQKLYSNDLGIRYLHSHKWLDIVSMTDRGYPPEKCDWYRSKACAIMANGDVTICCFDHLKTSSVVNIMDIDHLTIEHIAKREICKGCFDIDWCLESHLRKEHKAVS